MSSMEIIAKFVIPGLVVVGFLCLVFVLPRYYNKNKTHDEIKTNLKIVENNIVQKVFDDPELESLFNIFKVAAIKYMNDKKIEICVEKQHFFNLIDNMKASDMSGNAACETDLDTLINQAFGGMSREMMTTINNAPVSRIDDNMRINDNTLHNRADIGNLRINDNDHISIVDSRIGTVKERNSIKIPISSNMSYDGSVSTPSNPLNTLKYELRNENLAIASRALLRIIIVTLKKNCNNKSFNLDSYKKFLKNIITKFCDDTTNYKILMNAFMDYGGRYLN